MRGTRWLLLVAIAAILGGIGFTYRAQKKLLLDQAPPKPAPLPTDLNSSSDLWHWVETDTKTGRVIADILAQDFRELKESPRVDLKGVTIKLFSQKRPTYDLVKSSAASFFKNDHRLYSEGDVEITLDVPDAADPKRTLVSIKSSGVNFDISTGHAETDRPSSFVFERGDGTATGASYDPATHALVMKSDVKLDWKPQGPHARLMKIEGGSLEYRQDISEIWLKPWGRLTRENTVVEGENVVVHLQDDGEGNKKIGRIEAVKAHGADTYPNRKLQYSAGELWVDCDDGLVQKITAQTNARLVSTSDAAETTITAYHVELGFDPSEDQSVLSTVSASGNSVVTSKPLPGPGRQLAETHVLRGEKLEMKMRDGGRDIEQVSVPNPGTLEFVPNLPVQRHRILEGNNMLIAYGAGNRIESFRASGVRTTTDPTADEVKRKVPQSVTTSREMLARFDPKTGRTASIEQWGDFAYQQGERRAKAGKATLDSNQDVIHLETAARVWDPTGTTSADRIRTDQRTGDFTAEGNVNSSRLPDKAQNQDGGMLSGDQPLQAQAGRMDSTNRNRSIHYEGGVTMWQGANRIQAAVIDIDREKRTLEADRNVVTNLWESGTQKSGAPADPKKTSQPPAQPVLTVVRAPHLIYTDENRLAVYTGGAFLNRPGLDVKAAEIRAFLAAGGSDSRLERAFADGAVQIVQDSRVARRTGTAEHAEYHTGEQKVHLREGAPKLIERKPNGRVDTTEGADLTYYANDDRLLVNGSPSRPGQSQIKRK